MIEIISGIGIGLWGALAVTVVALLYVLKQNLIESKRDRYLRGDVDSAFERIEELERELNHLQKAYAEQSYLLTQRLTELYTAVDKSMKEGTAEAEKEE